MSDGCLQCLVSLTLHKTPFKGKKSGKPNHNLKTKLTKKNKSLTILWDDTPLWRDVEGKLTMKSALTFM